MQFFEPWEATVDTWTKNLLPGDIERRYVEIAQELLKVSISSSSSSCSSESSNYSMVPHSTIIHNDNYVDYAGRGIGSRCEILVKNQSSHLVDNNIHVKQPGTFPPLVNRDACEEDVEQVIARELFLHKPPPPAGYVCDICGTEGHFKNMCLKIPNKVDGFTPYQGAKQCFGEFICTKCKRKWMSYHSWANFAQKCVKCKIDVFPKKQRPLIPSPENVSKHPQHLCQKCNVVGNNCGITCKVKLNNGNINKTSMRGKHSTANTIQLDRIVQKQSGAFAKKVENNQAVREHIQDNITQLHHGTIMKTEQQSGVKHTERTMEQNKYNEYTMKPYEGFANIDYFRTITNM